MYLQSIKMLVIEWTRDGRVLWCDVRPTVKEQLSNVLMNPIFCNSDQLGILLTGEYCLSFQ